MRRLVYCVFFAFAVLPTFAQSQVVRDMENAVTELTGSFMDNPYHHANTIKIYNLARQAKDAVEDLYRQVPRDAEVDFYCILNMKRLLKSLEHITAGVTGHYPASVEATDFEALNPIFDAFGWTRGIIHSAPDIVLYEYRKDGFKMVLAKNTRHKKDGGDYNAVSYDCYTWNPKYKKHDSFIGRVVFGGNFQFVECGDDTIQYTKISKTTSKRNSGF